MVSVLVDDDGSERDVHDEAHGHLRFRPARRRGPRARVAGQVRISVIVKDPWGGVSQN